MRKLEVQRLGLLTTVQDWPGRAFRLGNRVLGNPEGAAGLKCRKTAAALRFPDDARICVTGAVAPVTLDGEPVPQWQSVTVPPGAAVDIGVVDGPDMRCCLLVAGGIYEPGYLGSTATFTLGRFDGHDGRPLRAEDVLTIGEDPAIGHRWQVASRWPSTSAS